MEEYKKVWKEMESLGWSNIPEGFHLEYFKDIIEATKTALISSQNYDCISNVSDYDYGVIIVESFKRGFKFHQKTLKNDPYLEGYKNELKAVVNDLTPSYR